MRPTFRWSVVAVLVLALVCTACSSGNSGSTRTVPSPSPSQVVPEPTEAPSLQPVPTLSESSEPAPEQTMLAPNGSGTTLIVPRNTIRLTCNMPKGGLPRLQDSSGNEYPRIVFNALCGAEAAAGFTGTYTFGQVGTEDAVDCNEFVIDGSLQSHVAWWCDGHQLLLTSPAAVIASYPDDTWRVLRELVMAYAVAYVRTHDKSGDLDLRRTACVMGRAIRNLKSNKMLAVGAANALVNDITVLLNDADYRTVSKALGNGYRGRSCG